MTGMRKSSIHKKDLHRAVDGELSKKETEKLKAVLKQDPGMREEFNSIKAVAEVSEAVVQPVKPARGFKNKVLAGLKKIRKGLTGK